MVVIRRVFKVVMSGGVVVVVVVVVVEVREGAYR